MLIDPLGLYRDYDVDRVRTLDELADRLIRMRAEV
jgi:hypothetical protein